MQRGRRTGTRPSSWLRPSRPRVSTDALVAEKYLAAHVNAGDAAATRGDLAQAARLYAAGGREPVAVARLVALTPVSTVVLPDARTAARGLAVSRRAVQSVFEKPEVGFSFSEVAPVDGQPTVLGYAPDGVSTLQLVGLPQELSSVAIVSGIPARNDSRAALTATYMLGLLKLVVPDWAGAGDWLTASAAKEDSTTVQSGRRIRLQQIRATNGSVYILSIERA